MSETTNLYIVFHEGDCYGSGGWPVGVFDSKELAEKIKATRKNYIIEECEMNTLLDANNEKAEQIIRQCKEQQ